MPNYKGHLVGGAITYGLLLYVFRASVSSLLMAIELCACTLLGALFPDIDTKSTGQKLVYRALFVVLLVLIAQQRWPLVACISVASFIPILSKHRGLFHSPWFLLGLSAVMILVTLYSVPKGNAFLLLDIVFFAGGGFSHLLLDFGIRGLVRRII